MLTWVDGKYNTSSCQIHNLRMTIEWSGGHPNEPAWAINTTFGKLNKRFADMKLAKKAAEQFARKTIELMAESMGGKVEWPPVVPAASGKS